MSSLHIWYAKAYSVCATKEHAAFIRGLCNILCIFLCKYYLMEFLLEDILFPSEYSVIEQEMSFKPLITVHTCLNFSCRNNRYENAIQNLIINFAE